MCIIWSLICMRSQSSRNELANGPYQSLYNFQRKKRRAGERYRQQMAPATLLFSFSLLHLSIYFWGCAHYYAIWYLGFSSSSSSLSLFLLFFFLLIFARDIYNEGVQCAFYASYLTLHYFPSRSRRAPSFSFYRYFITWCGYTSPASQSHTHTHKKWIVFLFLWMIIADCWKNRRHLYIVVQSIRNGFNFYFFSRIYSAQSVYNTVVVERGSLVNVEIFFFFFYTELLRGK